MTRLSVVIPHWPIDGEVDDALRACLASLPADCEKLVIVNDGTGFAQNVNIGLGLAGGDFIAVVTNDTRVVEGDVYDLCVPGTVTSPIVLDKPGIEPGGFHGAFWVAPREIIERVGPLDERFEGAFFEDDDYRARLEQEGIPILQIRTVRVVSRRVGLTMSKIRDQADAWYAANQRRFEEKWGWLPPPADPELAETWDPSRKRIIEVFERGSALPPAHDFGAVGSTAETGAKIPAATLATEGWAPGRHPPMTSTTQSGPPTR